MGCPNGLSFKVMQGAEGELGVEVDQVNRAVELAEDLGLTWCPLDLKVEHENISADCIIHRVTLLCEWLLEWLQEPSPGMTPGGYSFWGEFFLCE